MKKLILLLLMFAPLATFAQQKFGHVDAQAIMQNMPEFIKARGDLEAKSKEYENSLTQMQKEIQSESDKYEAAKSTMGATAQKETEAKIQGLIQKYQQAYQDNQQALQKLQQETMQPIMAKVMTAIKNVGKNGGYVFIMDVSAGIPYISETLSKDVTAEVKAELNKLK